MPDVLTGQVLLGILSFLVAAASGVAPQLTVVMSTIAL